MIKKRTAQYNGCFYFFLRLAPRHAERRRCGGSFGSIRYSRDLIHTSRFFFWSNRISFSRSFSFIYASIFERSGDFHSFLLPASREGRSIF
jgi:hypothetical protein